MARTKVTARKSTAGPIPRPPPPADVRLNEGSESEQQHEEKLVDEKSKQSTEDLSNEPSKGREGDSQGAPRADGVATEGLNNIALENEITDDRSFIIAPETKFGSDFDEDLNQAMSGEVNLSGRYCHFELTPSAPNPYLNVEGLGSIGVPLSSREGKIMAEHAMTLPGHDSNISDNNIWSINASQITFGNDEWSKFIRETVSKTVWGRLGIAPYYSPARCKLHKLLILGPGTGTLPKQSELADDGAFASILVQLPASFAGGNVQASHESGTSTIELSKCPATSILASYPGTELSFSTNTGYRLALLYNLVGTLPGTPTDLPKESLTTLKLRYVLQKWTEGSYEYSPTGKRFVYILDQKKHVPHKKKNGLMEAPPLTSQGKELVSCLRSVAGEFGYIVFSGQLTYSQSGLAEVGGRRHGWGAWEEEDYEDVDVDDLSFRYVDETEMTFDKMLEPDGTRLDGASIDLEEEDIVPMGFFTDQKVSPDDKDFDEGGLTYRFYRRAVLVLPQEEEEKIMRTVNETYWLSKLEKIDPSGPESLDPERIEFVMSRIREYNTSSRQRLMQLALKWQDLELWKKAMRKTEKVADPERIKEVLEAWPVFSFNNLVPVLDHIIVNLTSLNQKVDALKKLEGHAPPQDREGVKAWCTDQYSQTVNSMHSSNGWVDVSAIMEIGRQRGATFLAQALIPHFVKHPPTISCIRNLFNELLRHASTLPDTVAASPDVTGGVTTASKLASLCLENALKQPKYKIYGVSTVKKLTRNDHGVFGRLTDVIQLCIATGRLQECTVPLRFFLHTEPDAYKDFVQIYDQAFTEFRGSLARTKRPINVGPFKHFFAAIIGAHLEYLISFPRPAQVHIPTFGCASCDYCRRIDQYLRKPGQLQFGQRLYAAERKHLEPFLQNFALLQYSIEPPPGYRANLHLYLTKHSSLQNLQAWETRIAAAKSYLARIGTDADIAALMGDDHAKVQEAIAGTQAYVGSQRFKDALGPITAEILEIPPATTQRHRAPFASALNIPATRTLPLNGAFAAARAKKRKLVASEQASGMPSKKARADQYDSLS